MHAHDGRPVRVDALDLLAGADVPVLDEGVGAAAVQHLAVGVGGQGHHRARVVPQGLNGKERERPFSSVFSQAKVRLSF